MNDYGFDYLNYMTASPNMINYQNNNTIPYQNTNPNINPNMYNNQMAKNSELTDPYQGFIRGNSFQNLYSKYKNYNPMELNPKNEREALLYQLLQYKFALTDLNLYLDVNPNDQQMLSIFQKYLTISKQIKEKYERMYGPLTISDINPNITNWSWKNSPWPWEGE